MLNKEQVDAFESDGFLVLPDFVPRAECAALLNYSRGLAAQLSWEVQRMDFLPTLDSPKHEDYFLTSGDKIRVFFEKAGIAAMGPAEPGWQGVDKIGHALHDLDPMFDEFSRDSRLDAICRQTGMVDPLLLQSMVIFKQAHRGGEIDIHQDAAWLYTEPGSVLGFWFALEDATIENGCMWAQPGGHRTGLRSRFRRRPDGSAGMDWSDADGCQVPEEHFVPLEASAGTLIVLHGFCPHRSGPNRSRHARGSYSLHVIDGACRYPEDNWLQRSPAMPLRGFDLKLKTIEELPAPIPAFQF
ncbi:phytanoyl-CoA dioxygenase family protein [Skermanella aerolata]|uniref:phytanoyl-CoA dioxygenase family protein n=1 Tax=Skermanella aerolata TaxID=393310 RepID=UPI003D1BC8C0